MEDAATTCLLVEDDFVLRLHTVEFLRDIGVEHVAPFEEEADALAYLARARPGFAIVDYRLGRAETGERVVAVLRSLSVPLVIATGLGELPEDTEGLDDVPVLPKPLAAAALGPFLRAAGLLSPVERGS